LIDAYRNNGKATTSQNRKPVPVNPHNSDEDIPLYLKTESTLKYANKASLYQSARTGFTDAFLTPFALFLGATPFIIAIISAVPPLVSSLSQLLTQKAAKLFRSRYKLLVFTSYLNTYIMLPFIIAAFLNHKLMLPLIVAAIILKTIIGEWQANLTTTILGDAVPDSKRNKFFAKRTYMSGISAFISTFAAGCLLSTITKLSEAAAFGIVFSAAFIFTLISLTYRKRIYDPNPHPKKESSRELRSFVDDFKGSNYGTYAKFRSTFNLAVAIASPFFAIYMLQVLKLSYLQFTIITSATIIASFLTTMYLGDIIQMIGTKKVMELTSYLIVLVPFAWLFTTNWIILIIIEAFSGVVWAGFNLSTSIFMHEAVTRDHRLSYYSYTNVMIGVGGFIGTMIGSAIISADISFLGSVFLTLFLISAVARLLFAVVFASRIKEERLVSIGPSNFFASLVTIRPKEGLIYEVLEGQKESFDYIYDKKVVVPQNNNDSITPKRMPSLNKLGTVFRAK